MIRALVPIAGTAALLLTSCGDGVGALSSEPVAHLTVIHDEHRTGRSIEGALGVIRIESSAGARVYDAGADYDAPWPASGDQTYVVASRVAVPEGLLRVSFDVRPCTIGCPSLEDIDELDASDEEEICRTEVLVEPGDDKTVYLYSEDLQHFSDCEQRTAPTPWPDPRP